MNPDARTAPGRGSTAWLPVALVTPALLLLLVSYGILVREHQAWNLFPVVVHENGKNTLLGTVFYFRHFMRELPPALLMAIFTAGAFLIGAPGRIGDRRATDSSPREVGRWIRVLMILIGLELAIGASVAIHEEGWTGLKLDVLQYRTRDDRMAFGSHWQYHLLHMADCLLFPVAVVMILRGFTGQFSNKPSRTGVWMLGVGVFVFLLLTAVFGGGRDAFTNPLHLAHQFREIATHRIVTLLPALGFLFALENQLFANRKAAQSGDPERFRRGIGLLAVGTLIPLGIAWALRHRDVVSMAQKKTSLWVLFASHNFEHLLDALLVASLAGVLYLLAMSQGGSSLSRD